MKFPQISDKSENQNRVKIEQNPEHTREKKKEVKQMSEDFSPEKNKQIKHS